MFINSGRNRKFFIFASSISAGTAIWTFNFFSIIALEQSGDAVFNILVGILTLVTAIILTGIGFFVSLLKIFRLYIYVRPVYCLRWQESPFI
jgi:NO-binding membrane sensor protein with MHYT domain